MIHHSNKEPVQTNEVPAPGTGGPGMLNHLSGVFAPGAPPAGSPGVHFGEIEIADKKNPLSLRDAYAVAALFRETYREYDDHVLNEPEKIVELVSEGKWIAFVKRNEEGEIVGHGALLDSGHGLFDIGRLVVSPKARAGSIASKITAASMSYALDPETPVAIQVIQAETVTTHAYSQRVYDRHGFMPTGLHIHKFTQFFDDGLMRETVLIKTRVLDPRLKAERQVFVPTCYLTLAEQIYGNLGCTRVLLSEPASFVPAFEPSNDQIQVDNCDLAGFGLSIIHAGAKAQIASLLKVVAEQRDLGAKFIEVKLDLTQADSIAQIYALRTFGFIFGGIEVNAAGDKLVMQLAEGMNANSHQGLALHADSGRKFVACLMDTEFRICQKPQEMN